MQSMQKFALLIFFRTTLCVNIYQFCIHAGNKIIAHFRKVGSCHILLCSHKVFLIRGVNLYFLQVL